MNRGDRTIDGAYPKVGGTYILIFGGYQYRQSILVLKDCYFDACWFYIKSL